MMLCGFKIKSLIQNVCWRHHWTEEGRIELPTHFLHWKGCCWNHKHDLHFHELLYQLSYSPKPRGKESNLRRRHPMQRIILLSESQNMIPCQYCVLPLNYLSLISDAYSQIYSAPLTMEPFIIVSLLFRLTQAVGLMGIELINTAVKVLRLTVWR